MVLSSTYCSKQKSEYNQKNNHQNHKNHSHYHHKSRLEFSSLYPKPQLVKSSQPQSETSSVSTTSETAASAADSPSCSISSNKVEMDYSWRRTPRRCFLYIWILSTTSVLLLSTSIGVFGDSDSLALLSGTLKTFQKAGCDGENIQIQCPIGTTISIQIAQYGWNPPVTTPSSVTVCQSHSKYYPDLIDSMTDPNNNITCQLHSDTQTVVNLCQKKEKCKFKTNPTLFGVDPCPNKRKYVEIAYKCRPSQFKSAIACEKEVIQLSCNRSSRLAIFFASWGRTPYESMNCPQDKGVHEEACLSSFTTETVMQMCHGKRSCALGADRATFGNPCKPESRAYLKVINTCVPRRVLKEKYQGDLLPDELYEEEIDYETGDPVGVVKAEESLVDPNHSRLNPESTSKPNAPSRSQSSGRSSLEKSRTRAAVGSSSSSVLDIEGLTLEPDPGQNIANPNNSHDVHIIYLISQGIQAYDFISRNSDRIWLYVTISIALCLLLILIVILAKIWFQRSPSRRGPTGGCTNSKPSSSSAGPITSTGGLSDIDDGLSSVVMVDDVTELPSILRKSSSDRDELQRGVSTVTSTSSTMTSVSATTAMMNPSLPATMTLGRGGINRPRENPNIRFYYD